MKYLRIGSIVGSFGLEGTLKIFSTTDNAMERYQKGNIVFLFDPNTNVCIKELTVCDYRKSGQFDIVKFMEITTKEDADLYKRFEIKILKDHSSQKEGYFYFDDLENCDVFDEEQNNLGKVSKVEEFPAQITLRVTSKNGKQFFVPFLKQFIANVDISKKMIVIKVMKGML